MKEDDKEKKIFKAALKLFVENGIDHTSISLICKEAGISTGTPYLYFENKVDLINRLYLSIKKEILDVTATDLSASKLTYESFEKIWTEAVEWGVNSPYAFRFMTQMEASPYFNEDLEAQLANYEDNQLNLIKEGTENRTFKNLPPEYISELIFSHVVYTIKYINRTKTKERRIFFETLLNGIKY
jgi:AcrR family transcriptional regulator